MAWEGQDEYSLEELNEFLRQVEPDPEKRPNTERKPETLGEDPKHQSKMVYMSLEELQQFINGKKQHSNEPSQSSATQVSQKQHETQQSATQVPSATQQQEQGKQKKELTPAKREAIRKANEARKKKAQERKQQAQQASHREQQPQYPLPQTQPNQQMGQMYDYSQGQGRMDMASSQMLNHLQPQRHDAIPIPSATQVSQQQPQYLQPQAQPQAQPQYAPVPQQQQYQPRPPQQQYQPQPEPTDVFKQFGFQTTEEKHRMRKEKQKAQKQNEDVHGINQFDPMKFFR